MEALNAPLKELPFYNEMIQALNQGQTPVWIEGCIDIQKCHLISGIGRLWSRKLIVTHDEMRARQICEDYRFFDKNVLYFPAKDILFYNADVHSDLITGQRLMALHRLMGSEPLTIVTTIGGLMDKLMPPAKMKKSRIELESGGQLFLDELKKQLVEMGFERTAQVEAPGQFAIRGGILDIFNISDECPYRIELWGDEIDSIRTFDAQTQRSIDPCDRVDIYPASEFVLTREMLDRGMHLMTIEGKQQLALFEKEDNREAAARLRSVLQELSDAADLGKNAFNLDAYLPYFLEQTGTLLDYFAPAESLIVIDDPVRTEAAALAQDKAWQMSMKQRLLKGYALPRQLEAVTGGETVLARLQGSRTLMLSTLLNRLTVLEAVSQFSLNVSSMHSYRGDFRLLVDDLKKWKRKKYRLILVCSSQVRARRLSSQLMDEDLMAFYSEDPERVLAPSEIMIVRGGLRKGIEYPDMHFAILSESDMFGAEKKRKKSKRRQKDNKL